VHGTVLAENMLTVTVTPKLLLLLL